VKTPAQLTAAKAMTVQAAVPHVPRDDIASIARPRGEAGDRKKGFVLQEAMKLDGSSEKEALYASILVCWPTTSFGLT
jgi:hypothetical protein